MPEKHVDYRDLDNERRLSVIDSLAGMAIDVVTRHPDMLEHTLVEYMTMRHEYGYVAFLGIFHAIKQGRLVARVDGDHTVLAPSENME